MNFYWAKRVNLSVPCKVFIVNEHMAVGATGTVKCISKSIEDLTHKFHIKIKFTNADIRNFLDI